MGKNVTLIGGSGDGQIAKMANQMIVALTIGAAESRCWPPRRAPTPPRACARP